MIDSQNRLILRHMQELGPISSYDSFLLYGCTRLSARIFDLKEQGHDIKSRMIVKKNSEGKTVHYFEYFIEKQKN